MPSSGTVGRDISRMDGESQPEVTFSADGDQLVIEGLRPRVIVGEDLAARPLPSMAFKGNAETVLSGSDIHVHLPGIPDKPPASKSPDLDSESKIKETNSPGKLQPHLDADKHVEQDLANIDIASVSSKGYVSDMSEAEDEDEEHEFEFGLDQLADENETPRSPSPVLGKTTHLHFHTQANALTVQGVDMTITFGGQLHGKHALPRLCRRGAGSGFHLPNMTFSSKDTAMVVRGAQGVVHVNPQRGHTEDIPVQESTSDYSERRHGLKPLEERKISDYRTLSDIPIRLLSYDIRLKLAILLENNSLGRDWRSLADKMGIPYPEIRYMEREKSPLFTVLDRWETAGEYSATVGRLLSMLAELDRKDAITTLTEHLVGIH